MENPMRLIATTMLLLSFAMPATADDLLDWEKVAYKKENPDELAYFVILDDDCPATEKEVSDIVEGVFVRSQIKPTDNWDTDSLYLAINLNCVPLHNNNPVYGISIRFARFSGFTPVLYDSISYSGLGIGAKTSIVKVLKDNTEEAITDYIKVNFDLGD